jgi:hypothetical protein
MQRRRRNHLSFKANTIQKKHHELENINMWTKKMKKGYIFLMDGIFAVILLAIGLIIISSNRVEQSSEIPLSLSLDNSLDLLSSVKIVDICEGCSCSIKKMSELCLDNDLKNRQESLLDYIGELYSRGKKQEAFMLIEDISIEKDIFKEKALFDVEIRINNDTVYPNIDLSDKKKKSKNLLSSRKIIFGYYENNVTGVISYWGPYEVREEIWEKQ